MIEVPLGHRQAEVEAASWCRVDTATQQGEEQRFLQRGVAVEQILAVDRASLERMDHLLDKDNAIENFTFVGYQPAIEGVDGQYLIDQGLVPENLRTSVLSNDQIAKGYRSLQLSTDVEALWQDAWSKFTAGG